MARGQEEPLVTALAAALVAFVVVMGGAFTWYVFALSCSELEHSPQAWRSICGGPWIELLALGPLALVLCGVGAFALRRPVLYWIGLAAAVTTALTPWLLVGDPSGNFSGLLP